MRRRDFLAGVAAAGTAVLTRAEAQTPPRTTRTGRIKQSLMRVNFGRTTTLSFEEMCRIAVDAGAAGFDLVGQQDWPTLKKYGLVCSTSGSQNFNLRDGSIRPELHDGIEKGLHAAIDACAANGVRNIIAYGGERRGISDEQGKAASAALFNRVKAHAEDKGVNICLEMVNSKYTDPEFGRADAICDRLDWAADVCRRVNSPRMRILFDIYHVQIMEGDLAANIRKHYPLIGHFHAAGVPERHELDETQEVNWRFVAKTIADLGYTGYIAHEWRVTPGKDPADSVKRSVAALDA
ncbi:MAG TPA: sugar phosphate isomerase/epimerase family protein [Vicinamibacterales bacterium]|nr:sugar phosphate isomerase/epimerase family protein [Vicinamibacterales bacterium]